MFSFSLLSHLLSFKPSEGTLCVADTALAVQRPLQEPECIFPSSERAAGCTASIGVAHAVILSVHRVNYEQEEVHV